MQEQKRKKNVGTCFLRGLGRRVILKLQRVVWNIYHDCKGLVLRDGRVQKDHTLQRECWAWVEAASASLDAGGKL
jgi:hypothetical protein